MEDPNSSTATGLAALYARLRGSLAAREMLWVLAAQGLATLIALGADVLLFRRLLLRERGMLTATLGLRNVLLYVADMGLALTTVRVGAEYFGKGQLAAANAIFRRALATRLALALLVLGLACALAPALCRFPLAAGDRPGLVTAAALALLGLTATSWGVDVSQATRSFGRYFAHQVVEASLKAGAVALVIVALTRSLSGGDVAGASAEVLLLVMAAAALAAGLASVLIQRSALAKPKELDAAAEKEVHSQLRSFNRYAVAIALLYTVSGCVEVFLVQLQCGPEETAIFSGAQRLALVLLLLGGVLNTVLLPRVAVLDTPAACAAYVRKTLFVGIPLAIVAAGVLAASAGVIVPLLWSGRYGASITPLRWLCPAYAFSIVLAPLNLVFYPLRGERTLLVLQALGVALAVALGAYLIPRYGAVGAAWSSLGARALLALLSGAALYRALHSPAPCGRG
ncbi:MAG: polysaccharide biosynthesis C-terminal domain-containing protein [Planctomycetota bacterium]